MAAAPYGEWDLKDKNRGGNKRKNDMLAQAARLTRADSAAGSTPSPATKRSAKAPTSRKSTNKRVKRNVPQSPVDENDDSQLQAPADQDPDQTQNQDQAQANNQAQTSGSIQFGQPSQVEAGDEVQANAAPQLNNETEASYQAQQAP